MNAFQLKKAVGTKVWNNYYKFTIERNPYDRLVSFWKWRSFWYGLDCSFEEFALSALGYNSTYKREASGFSNVPFYSFDNTHLCVDKVIYFEHLKKGLQDVFNDIGIDHAYMDEVPQLKAGIRNGSDFRNYYSRELQQIAEENFVIENRFFGYTF